MNRQLYNYYDMYFGTTKIDYNLYVCVHVLVVGILFACSELYL